MPRGISCVCQPTVVLMVSMKGARDSGWLWMLSVMM